MARRVIYGQSLYSEIQRSLTKSVRRYIFCSVREEAKINTNRADAGTRKKITHNTTCFLRSKGHELKSAEEAVKRLSVFGIRRRHSEILAVCDKIAVGCDFGCINYDALCAMLAHPWSLELPMQAEAGPCLRRQSHGRIKIEPQIVRRGVRLRSDKGDILT